MMGSSYRRTKTVIEYVMFVGEGGNVIDAKSFDYHYRQIRKRMEKGDGVDFSYDDAFTVHLTDDEIIFRLAPTDD